MKYSDLTYYLLVILCLVAASCTADGGMYDFPDSGDRALITDANVNFVISFSANPSTRVNESEGLASERTISDVHVYTFQENQFVEEVQYVLIGGKDGDASRNITGKLSEVYAADLPMEFVVIANTGKREIGSARMVKGGSKAKLYEQLVFSFQKDGNWSGNIPMWGLGVIENVKNGDNNFGALKLVRAVAKVNVTVAGGAGLENFRIAEIRLHRYNTEGYCAPLENGSPSIPPSSTLADDADFLTSGVLDGEQGNKFENKFYIAEHKNVGVDDKDKVYLTIAAEVREVEKTYTVQFSTKEGAYDVLRNNIYLFNITGVDKVTSALSYEVKQWEEEIVDVPSFD